ncbi:AraC family transcriptional regulator [Martelella lutilitoris]|uniref:AraC family transcriptional regulator n=1 Tax=Martelella lutilitoris TaxID=2583532 RepID=A0A5C4JSB8_9HYPH|nr:AraC family transcriptional regulator [Martelella lutilitoris]TNB48258.1 AraC family transcriptional regulator [Martelella lutilitoris]
MKTNSGMGFEGPDDTLQRRRDGDLERLCRGDAIITAPVEDGIERIEARFCGNGFSPHRHDTYALGLTMSGVQTFSYRGATRFSLPGRLIILHPDELHDGGAGDDAGLTYRMIYLSPERIGAALETMSGFRNLPFVQAPVIDDPALRATLADALGELDAEMGELKRDGLIADIAGHLLRLGDAGAGCKPGPVARPALRRCREYLAESAGTDIGSETLEAISGLDRFSLARQFRAAFGTSPHRYLVQRRLERAKAMIAAGETLAGAALSAGFADQSHMTRHFRKTYGMTPGRFQTLAARHRPSTLSKPST